jgi:hypothetical protein
MPDAPNQGVLNALQNPTNSVEQGYQQVQSQIINAQNIHDNNMLKVLEFAGDGQVDAAKAYAAAKGIAVPPQVLQNADLAQGLSFAGKMAPEDPAVAHNFTMAWMNNQNLPLQQRVEASAVAAGIPQSTVQQKFQGMIDLAQWKAKNLPNSGIRPTGVSPGQARFNAGQKAADVATMATVNTGQQAAAAADAARTKAYSEWDANNPKGASSGLTYTDDSPESPDNINDYGQTINQGPGQTYAMPAAPAQAASPSTPPPIADGQPHNQITYGTGIVRNQTSATPPPIQAAPATAPVAAPASSGASSLPSGLPAGSVMMGTTGGKPVYQDPAGNQYIDNGNPQQ